MLRRFNNVFKIFVFLILLWSLILVLIVLLLYAIIADLSVMLYFITFGLIGEIKCEYCCHGLFLVKGLSSPWKPLFVLFENFRYFFNKGLGDEIESNKIKITEKGPSCYRQYKTNTKKIIFSHLYAILIFLVLFFYL